MSSKVTGEKAGIAPWLPSEMGMELTSLYEDCEKPYAEQLASLFMTQEHPEMAGPALARLRKLAKHLVMPAMT